MRRYGVTSMVERERGASGRGDEDGVEGVEISVGTKRTAESHNSGADCSTSLELQKEGPKFAKRKKKPIQ